MQISGSDPGRAAQTHRKVLEDGEAKMPDWGDMGLVRDLYIRFVDKLE
jgi:hypothetical protein